MNRITASALDRLDACAGSAALPQRRHVGADTKWGTVVATFRDDCQRHGRDYALRQVEDPDHAARCAVIDTTDVPPGAESEVAIAYDPDTDTSERLVLDGHRAYPDDGRIYGTADRVGIAEEHGERILFLEDDKSGAVKMNAQEALQLRLLALAFCRLLGIHRARGSMSYLRHDGTWWRDRFEFDALDLDAIREQLLAIRLEVRRAIALYARGGLPELSPGLHCDHCAAAFECPAFDRQRDEIARVEAGTLVEYMEGLPPDRRGALVETAAIVAKKAEQVREAARAYVKAHGPISLPSGRRLALVETAAHVMAPEAKRRIATVRADLRAQGLITTGTTRQLRIVGKARKE